MDTTSHPNPREAASLSSLVRRWWPHALAGWVLGMVYLAYTQPDFVIDVANQVWACF
jgi:hypothetical protein